MSSSTEEVVALAKVAARSGGYYVTHIRNYFDKMDEAIDEAIATRADTKLVISHHQTTGFENFGKAPATLKTIESAAERIPLPLRSGLVRPEQG